MKLAIVTPWFGRELKGGAEQQAWQIAARLATRGHEIEVLTTCCRSHQDDWSTNRLPAGMSTEPEGFSTRRFPVVPRDRAAFDRVCGHLLSLPPEALRVGIPPVESEDGAIFADELIKSPELLLFLSDYHWDYDWVLFLPYLYGPVLHGLSIVGQRAAFQPCLHDEAYAYLPQVAEAFRRCGKLLFNSDGERELALRLFGPAIYPKSMVVGEGVETPGSADGVANGSVAAAADDPYVLYLGRKDAGKNVPLLLKAFRRFRAARPNAPLRLLLAGNGEVDLNGQADTAQDLGLVTEAEKEHLLANCVALFQPSQNESFSRVMMEAWMHGKPVAAHSACLATAVAVERSRGGWTAGGEDEWAALLAEVARAPERRLAELGARGKSYALELADWDRVMERYEEALAPVEVRPPDDVPPGFAPAEINQFLPNLSYGDAISNHAIWIRDRLRGFGFVSNIYVRYIDPRVEHECRVFSPDTLHASDAAIYHHSIGSEITPHLLEFTGPKCIVYHNITPAEFFLPDRPDFAHVLRVGREDLPKLAPDFEVAVGDSSYNVAELQADGFHQPTVLSIAVDPQKWSFDPDPELMVGLQDGKTNILFVGRISPNKKQDDLVAAFAEYLAFDPTARLIIVGKAEENDPYAAHLLDVIRDLIGFGDSVFMPGSITEAQLAACYRSAHLFWSMSEHEGFCVPLIESMWFDVPVLAFASSAVPETLGDAGIMFTDKSNLRELAALAKLMVSDRELRGTILAAQQRQREKFLPHRVTRRLVTIAQDLVNADQAALRRAGKRWPQLQSSGEVAEINQCLPNLSVGDAISNQAIAIRNTLQQLGYRSKIFARYHDPELALECEVFSEQVFAGSKAVIYHHSTGTDIASAAQRFRGPKALIYHNITPAEFYAPYSRVATERLRKGREELRSMAPDFPLAFGVSRYNVAELQASGFRNAGVLPICVDHRRWEIEPDRDTLAALSDGRTNLLFVGRITPNKKQDDLIKAFAEYLRLDPDARLILVGAYEEGDAYAEYLDKLSAELRLGDSVLRPGLIPDAQLLASYQTADLFWSMSEHEGFGVPLVEAMSFDVPVFAYDSTAVPETLGGAGELFPDKSDPAALAKRAHQLVHDSELRKRVIDAQRKRRSDFGPEKFIPILEQLAEQLCSPAMPVVRQHVRV